MRVRNIEFMQNVDMAKNVGTQPNGEYSEVISGKSRHITSPGLLHTAFDMKNADRNFIPFILSGE